MAAVLGVGLREHHQLDVVGVAAEGGEGLDEVVDLVVGEGEAERAVGFDEGGAAPGEHGHAGQRARGLVAEKDAAGGEVVEHDLGHAVVQARRQRSALRRLGDGRRAMGRGGSTAGP